MVPRIAFMHPDSLGYRGGSHRTYIQNNFYGNSSNNVWGCGFPVGMRSQYYMRPYQSYFCPSWMPPFLQNAMIRLMGGQLLSAIFNPGRQDIADIDLRAELTEGTVPTNEELTEVNNRYEAYG